MALRLRSAQKGEESAEHYGLTHLFMFVGREYYSLRSS